MTTPDRSPAFLACVAQCANTPELVAEFDRLSGTHLATLSQRSPLEAMIDEATGRDAEALEAFLSFVWEFVYTPLQGGV